MKDDTNMGPSLAFDSFEGKTTLPAADAKDSNLEVSALPQPRNHSPQQLGSENVLLAGERSELTVGHTASNLEGWHSLGIGENHWAS